MLTRLEAVALKKGKLIMLIALPVVVLVYLLSSQPPSSTETTDSLLDVIASIEGIGAVKIYIHESDVNSTASFFQMGTEKESENGILIVCEGADNINVQRQLYSAIQRVMDIPSHRIMILPMKKEDTLE